MILEIEETSDDLQSQIANCPYMDHKDSVYSSLRMIFDTDQVYDESSNLVSTEYPKSEIMMGCLKIIFFKIYDLKDFSLYVPSLHIRFSQMAMFTRELYEVYICKYFETIQPPESYIIEIMIKCLIYDMGVLDKPDSRSILKTVAKLMKLLHGDYFEKYNEMVHAKK